MTSIALCDFITATPQRPVGGGRNVRHASRFYCESDTLDFGALVVVRDETAPIVVLDLDKVLVAAHAVQPWGRRELRKERSEDRQRLLGHVRHAREHVRVQDLGWDRADVRRE